MKFKSLVLIILGSLALILGAVGILLPIMPTTPFVLVSAACFGGSSPRLYGKLVRNRYFGEFITHYQNKSGISKNVRIKALVFLWGMLLLSMLIAAKLPVTIILCIAGAAVTAHILLIKSKADPS